MTNNELTLEQAIQHTDEKAAALSGPCAEQHKQLAEWLRELQERRKVDSEPVIVVGDDGGDALSYRRLIQSFAPGTKLYRHAQQPVVDADDNFYSWFGREWQDNYQHNQYTTAAKQMLGVMAESAWKAATERQRQKQSVSVPDVKIYEDVPYEVGRFKTHRDCYCDGWNACRAAMLQELKKSAGAEAICRSDENVQVLHTKSPAQSDCCPAQNVVAPAQSPIDHGYLPECECSGCKATARICTEMAVNSLVIPDEMTSEQAYEIGYCYGDPVDVFARGANWMRQHIIDSTLAAAPQSPGSEPATVPGKWIPVSERMPENDGAYLCWDNRYVTTYAFIFGAWQANQFVAKNITHWMPLPAAPQEVR